MGCGRSDRPDTPEFWTIDYFVQELGKVREALGLEKVHLWGHSWGGLLAIEYVLTQPQGLASLTLASTPNSIPLWVEEANRLRQELPADTQAILTQHEEAGTTDSEEYENAVRVFNSRYLIRCSAPSLGRASKESGKVYRVMNGPSEFHITGVLKDWDRIARLPDIQLPTLITSGRYDEATPKINEITHKAINNSEWVLFEKSAHMSHIEEKERYLATMASFLTRVEAPSHP
jgi:proline-specific peptidase